MPQHGKVDRNGRLTNPPEHPSTLTKWRLRSSRWKDCPNLACALDRARRPVARAHPGRDDRRPPHGSRRLRLAEGVRRLEPALVAARNVRVVIVFRGFADLLFRRLIPWPSLFGADSQQLRDEDVMGRRRAWYWRKKLRLVLVFVVVVSSVYVVQLIKGTEARRGGAQPGTSSPGSGRSSPSRRSGSRSSSSSSSSSRTSGS